MICLVGCCGEFCCCWWCTTLSGFLPTFDLGGVLGVLEQLEATCKKVLGLTKWELGVWNGESGREWVRGIRDGRERKWERKISKIGDWNNLKIHEKSLNGENVTIEFWPISFVGLDSCHL